MTLSQDDVVLLARLFGNYVQNTKDGKKTALRMLGATVKSADIRNHYRAANHHSNEAFNFKDLIYYSGWVYKDSVGLGADQIEVETGGNLEACETTGILGPKDYCVQVVKDYGHGGREHLVSMSNFARLSHDNPAIRDTAKQETCRQCPVRTCEYNPQREPQQLRLISAPKHMGA